ncbi:MAG: nucleotidyltransferase domain-containing protein [Candidatus Bathyarchaeota archaeon]|nr:nucleotidyltransferase domain-containing protein [Candidatus Bathyarchaeota archaeon]
MAAKPQSRFDTVEVTYSSERWSQLTQLRHKAQDVIAALHMRHMQAIVHGSIARGDVNKDSDIDVFVLNPPSSFQVETALQQANITISNRTLIQATPAYAMKAYIEVDPTTTVSFPLMELRRVERQFYRFSGEVNLTQLKQNTRVAGVDKRLMLIEPTQTGHIESSIVGGEEQAAKTLRVAVETVLDRVHALKKRDAVGRTGVFIKKELTPDETFELALKHLADENPAVRRRQNR